MALLAATILPARAQLSLDSCLVLARENYPAIRQYSLVAASRDFTVSNASKGYLPQVSARGTAAAFTDPADLGQLGDFDNSLYNIGVTVKQNIYDGGAIAAKRRTARAQAEVETRRLDVTMYDVEGRVEEIFFGILVIDAQLKQVATLIEDLGIGRRTIETMKKNGVANQSDLDAVDVEIVKSRQKEVSLRASREAYAQMLGRYIGRPFTSCSPPPATPEEGVAAGCEEAFECRPEISYFSAQKKLLDERRKALDVGLRPKLSAFATAMYHSKPLSLMKNSLLAVGLSLNWNIGAFYTRKNDIKGIENDRQRILSEQDLFIFNTALQAQQSQGNINNLRQQLELDDDVVRLRESIRSKAEKKVTLGTETVNEMLRDINAASEARQQRDIHEIQLSREIYKNQRINGK